MEFSHIENKKSKKRRKRKMAELALLTVVDGMRSRKENNTSEKLMDSAPQKNRLSKSAKAHQSTYKLFTDKKTDPIVSDENIKKIQEMESRYCSSDEFPILWDGEE